MHKIIANTTLLIALANINKLDILHQLYDNLVLKEACELNNYSEVRSW